MKIKSINLQNNNIFGNFDIDFLDVNGNIVDTIILAGENGCGKTTLLNIIYDFSIINTSGAITNEKRTFNMILSQNELEKVSFLNQNNLLLTGEFQIVQDFTSPPNYWSRIKVKYCVKNTITDEYIWCDVDSSRIFGDKDVKSLFKTIYSTVEINYSPGETRTVTSKDVDEKIESSVKSGSDLATQIKQMFIDIQNNDANELNEWVSSNIGEVPPIDIIDKRISRFKSAFSYIFDGLNYKGIKTNDGKKDVLFTRNGIGLSISSLSSGEKQIVFRGGFLLKDKQSTKGSIVLIDEPEISLHPNWQKKILNYYKKLFIDKDTNQTSQIFVVTHSPFIVHNIERYNDKVIVLKKDSNNKIVVLDRPEYYTYGSLEIVEDAFNELSFTKEEKPIVFVEGETDEKYLKTCISMFRKSGTNYDVKWIGRYNGKKAENSGDTALNNLYNFALANPQSINRKTILLYDSDTNKASVDTDNIYIRAMPFNQNNALYKKGIENLLCLPSDFNKDDYYSTQKKTDDYGAENIIKTLDKTKLCNEICENSNNGEKEGFLKSIESVLQIIELVLKE